MKKIILFCLVAIAFSSCEGFEAGAFIKVSVESTLGSLYTYDLELDCDSIKSGESYEVEYGYHTVTLDLFDYDGVYLSTTTKEVYSDGYTENVKFYLYFIGTTGVLAE